MLDVHDFAVSLASWSLVPPSWIPLLSLAIPAVELAIGVAWFLGFRRRQAAAACMILLTIFTTLYVAQLVVGETPECACFGAIMRLEAIRHESTIVIARNALLLAMLVVGLGLCPDARRETQV
ncbi:MAG: hypothetical protein Kow0022_18570 [Phycisphaerales bacterium]